MDELPNVSQPATQQHTVGGPHISSSWSCTRANLAVQLKHVFPLCTLRMMSHPQSCVSPVQLNLKHLNFLTWVSVDPHWVFTVCLVSVAAMWRESVAQSEKLPTDNGWVGHYNRSLGWINPFLGAVIAQIPDQGEFWFVLWQEIVKSLSLLCLSPVITLAQRRLHRTSAHTHTL